MRTTTLLNQPNYLKMKKLILTLLAAALAPAATNAQILWKISGNNAKQTSYLLGTHHLAPLSMLDSIAGFNDALAAVDAVAGEVDMAKMNAEARSLMGYMLAPADSSLTALLAPAQVDSLTAVLQKYMGPQVSAAQMAQLKPAAVATQLALFESMVTMPDAAQALAEGKQLDSEVQSRALALNKPVIPFETAEEQMSILMGAPLAEQARLLMEAVKQSLDGTAAESTRKLTEAYLAQNLAAIAELIFSDQEMEVAEVERLIFARNRNWAATLADILPERPVLVAVGAGHLPGDEGLISLLRTQGYTVEPVK